MINRRHLLTGASLLATERALAQPMPTGWPVGKRDIPRGPTQVANVGESGTPSLTLDFMTPGTLDPRITFTRASSATYTDASGTIQTAGMNLCLRSENISTTWISPKGGGTVGAIIRTADQMFAPNGTNTADKLDLPATPNAGNYAFLGQSIAVNAAVHTFSVWLKGSVGGEQVYLFTETTTFTTFYSLPIVTLTTDWQRFTFTTPVLTAATWYFSVGGDRRDVSQAGIAAQTIFVWGAQVEQNTFASAYAVTTTVPNGAPRWDYDPVTHALRGLLIEEQRTNILLNSAVLSTQSVSVPASVQALSFYGTGTITLSGAFAGSLVGTGPYPSRASLIFTPTAGVLTLTVTGSVLNAQLE